MAPLIIVLLLLQSPARPDPAVEGPEPASALEPWLPTQPEKAPRRGIGLMVAGAISLGAIGVPLIGVGAYGFAEGRRCEQAGGGSECSGSLLGTVTLGVGIVGALAGLPLLATGAQRFSDYRAWERRRHVSLHPRIVRSYGTWTPGFELRF